MKTSKIILIGFFCLVGLFMLSLLIQIDNIGQESRFEKAAIALPNYKHLVLVNSANVELYQADTDSAIVHFDLKTEAVFPAFEIKGDTLVLSWPNHDNNWGRAISCSGLKTVTVKNSSVNINEFAGDSIWVLADSGEVRLNKTVEFDFVSLVLKNSHTRISGTIVKSIDAKLNNSTAELKIEQINELVAELQDSSRLKTWKVLHTDIRSDASSRYFSQ